MWADTVIILLRWAYNWAIGGTIADIAPFIEAERSDMTPEDKDMLTVYLHADKDTPMEMINGIKNELRRLHVLRIFYNTDAAKQ